MRKKELKKCSFRARSGKTHDVPVLSERETSDEAFWQMIRERRKEKTIPFAEVKKRLGLPDTSGKAASKKKRQKGG